MPSSLLPWTSVAEACSSWATSERIWPGACLLHDLLADRSLALVEPRGLWVYSDHTRDAALDRLLITAASPASVDDFEYARFIPHNSSLFIGQSAISGFSVNVGTEAHSRHLHDQLRASSTAEREVAVVLATAGYADMLANFLCSAHSVGRRNILVISASRTVLRLALENDIGFTTPVPSIFSSIASETATFGTLAYQELMLFRTRAVMRILDLGYRPIVADIDTVWLSDPWLAWREVRDFDLLVTDDNNEVCGCFVYLNSTAGSRSLWSILLKSHVLMVDDALKNGRLASFADSEQKILTRLIYGREYKGDLRVFVLPKDSFPSGYSFFSSTLDEKKAPLIVHNNFIIGKEPKVSRFQRYGLWLLSQHRDNLQCSNNPLREWELIFVSMRRDRLPVLNVVSPLHNSVQHASPIIVQVINELTPLASAASKLWLKVDPPSYLPFDYHAIYELQSTGKVGMQHLTVNIDRLATDAFVSVGVNETVFAVDRGCHLTLKEAMPNLINE